MTDAEFLRMCQMCASHDTGGQYTDEKLTAIEKLEMAPRCFVRRLLELHNAATQRAKAAEAERARLVARAEAAEAQLAAVPVDELRRWKEHSSVGSEVSAMRYDRDKAWRDHDAIRYWLDGCEDDGVPPAATFKPEVQP